MRELAITLASLGLTAVLFTGLTAGTQPVKSANTVRTTTLGSGPVLVRVPDAATGNGPSFIVGPASQPEADRYLRGEWNSPSVKPGSGEGWLFGRLRSDLH